MLNRILRQDKEGKIHIFMLRLTNNRNCDIFIQVNVMNGSFRTDINSESARVV